MNPSRPENCLVGASAGVGERKEFITRMIRLENDDSPVESYGIREGQMSGWLFLSDTSYSETDIYWLEDLFKGNEHIAPYLSYPAPCDLIWQSAQKRFVAHVQQHRPWWKFW